MNVSHAPAAPAWTAPGHDEMARFSAHARLMILCVPCVLLSLLLWDRPDFLISSDSLFPAAFVWDALRHADPWSGLQQPHIPSFFPDLLVFGVIQALTDNWRVAMAGWVLVVLPWLAVLLSGLAADIAWEGKAGEAAPARWRETALFAVLSLMMLLFLGAILGLPRFTPVAGSGDPFFPWLFILVPYTHGGPFLLALSTAVLAFRTLHRPTGTRLAALAILSCAAGISDQLCLFSLLGPVMAAMLGGRVAGVLSPDSAPRVLASVWSGGLAGLAWGDGLDRQHMPLPSLATIPDHASRFLTSLGDHPGMTIVLAVLALALLGDLRRLGVKGFLGDFWSVFAATAAFGSVLLLLLFYEDVWSYRYALPVLWWAVIRAAVVLILLSHERPLPVRLATGILAAGLALHAGAAGAHVPRLLVWDSPLAACLREHGPRAGLADFWIARAASAATDWRLQIEPINGYGEARVWGNNRFWFTHDLHDRSRRPPFRFIVMDRLPEDKIAAAFGQPDRVTRCGASTVWLFDDSARLHRALERMSPFLADVFATAPPL